MSIDRRTMSCQAVIIIAMFFSALHLGTPREYDLHAAMYASGVPVTDAHDQLKVRTVRAVMSLSTGVDLLCGVRHGKSSARVLFPPVGCLTGSYWYWGYCICTVLSPR
jgi:hypothetical protein